MSSTSPLLSVNVDELPRWVKQRARNVSNFSSGRLRLIAIASVCMLLGYLLTSSLSTPSLDEWSYVPADVLEVPSDGDNNKNNAGLDGHSEPSPAQSHPHSTAHRTHNRPSIKGALSHLGHAVSGHISTLTNTLRPSTNRTYAGAFTSTDSFNLSHAPNTTEQILTPNGDLLGVRPMVGKVTIIFGGAAIYERALRTHVVHDRMHGYPLHVLRHGIMDDVWSKPAYMLNLLLRELSKPESERLQWLLWVDADTILLNPYVPVEVFLPPSPEFDDVNMLVTRDWNGLNNGVFPVRVCQWSVDLFAAIVSYRFYRPDASLTFRDQSAMNDLLGDPKFQKNIVWAPQRWFNAYQGEHNETLAPFQVRRGDFLVHFAGVGDREARMLYWLERTDQHLPDWEIELRHTSYPGEAREFWMQERGKRSEAARLLSQAKKTAQELWEKTEVELKEYQIRLQEAERNAITKVIEKLKQTSGQQNVDANKIEEGIEDLKMVRTALDAITTESNKKLLKEAHEALFSAEKVLLTSPDKSTANVQSLEERTAKLKELILQPKWSREEMTHAIDEVRKLRASLEAALPPAPVEPEQAAKVAAIEQQKYEAEVAKAEILGIDTHPVPPTEVTTPDRGDPAGDADTVVVSNVPVTHTQDGHAEGSS